MKPMNTEKTPMIMELRVPFTIIEKNSGPGGTWYENRYPGARVDVGSHEMQRSPSPSFMPWLWPARLLSLP